MPSDAPVVVTTDAYHPELVHIEACEPSALAKTRNFGQSPAAMYLSSLSTEKSRQTARESLHRITSVFGHKGKQDWIVFPWERLDAQATTFARYCLIERHGPTTVRLTLTMLRRVLHCAFVLGYTTHEAWARATSWPPFRAKALERGRALTTVELSRLHEHLQELPGAYGDLTTAIFAVGIGGGLRREEISRLHVEALRPDGLLHVYGKGRKERKVSLLAGAAADIERWLTTRARLDFRTKNMFVSLAADGRCADHAITPNGIAKRVSGILLAVGLRDLATHDLRRTYATRLLDVGDVLAIQRLMGHESPATTAKYDKRGEQAGAKATAQVYVWGDR